MELRHAIRERRSIRAFKATALPESLVRDLVETSLWAPSWGNTQSTFLFVVSGPPLDAIKDAYHTQFAAKIPRSFDITPPRTDWPPYLAARTKRLQSARADSTGSHPSAKPAPASADFFGAPVVVFLAVDAVLQPEYAAYDAGILTQTFCLAAHNHGFGTCIMAQAVAYPEVLRQIIPRTADKKFVVGIALGYPDEDAPVNRFARERVPVEERASWVR